MPTTRMVLLTVSSYECYGFLQLTPVLCREEWTLVISHIIAMPKKTSNEVVLP
jgi:hypothetical protein